MAIDPNIALGVNTQQANPLQGVGSLLNTLSGVQQFKQQNQAIKANQAVSAAVKQNTDAQGNIDMNAVVAQLAQDPNAAYNIPQIVQQFASGQKALADAKMAKFNEALQQNTYWGQQLGSLVNKPDLTSNDVGQVLMDGVKTGMIQPAQAAQYASQIPTDPSKLRAWTTQHWKATMSTGDQLKAIMPQTQVINTGGQQQIVNIDPVTGQPTLAGSLTNTLDPGTATSPVSYTGPQGQQVTTTRQNFAGGMQGGAPEGYNGRYNAGQPQGGTPGAVEGPTPAEQAGAVTGATAQAQGSANASNTLATETADAPIRVGYLKQAQNVLNDINTGPGTDWKNQWASALQQYPGISSIVTAAGADPQKIASYDEFKKIMANYAGNVSASAGTGTDARLNSAITGNANPNISKLANQDIIVKTIAAEQYRAAKNDAWQNALNNGQVQPQQFNQWSAQWNKNTDPAVYAFPNMNADQRQRFVTGMSAADLAKFKAQLGDAVRSGSIQLPGQ
jgi:hypothetical protein